MDFTPWHWLGLSVLLLILELLTATSGFLLGLAGAALITALTTWLIASLNWAYQFIIFALCSVLSTLVWRWYLKKKPIVSEQPYLNQRAAQYVGRRFTLEAPIVNGRGSLHVDDTVWRISGPDLPAGTLIRVTGTQGTILHVEAANE